MSFYSVKAVYCGNKLFRDALYFWVIYTEEDIQNEDPRFVNVTLSYVFHAVYMELQKAASEMLHSFFFFCIDGISNSHGHHFNGCMVT
jgi:hypothetical protein